MSHESRELVLFTENDHDLWMRRRPEFLKNTLRKVNAGQYDREKSVKLWNYLAIEAAKKYAKNFASASEWSSMFSVADRKEAAKDMRDVFEQEYRAGEHEDLRKSLLTKAQRASLGTKKPSLKGGNGKGGALASALRKKKR